jgi:CBS domain-containing membrane protein
MRDTNGKTCGPVEISELDILAAMKHIQGYIDISPGDFKEVFQVAYSHAIQRIMNSLTAADIMTSPVNTVGIEMDLRQTATFLAEKRISGAPVVDSEGRIAGVVSEKDFLSIMGVGKPESFMQIVAHCLKNKGCMTADMKNHAIREIMTTPAITAGPQITVGAISALFIDRQINRIPIVDAGGKPIGIVTRTDLVHANLLSR